MTISSAFEMGLFRPLPKTPSPALDIPLVLCPVCEKRRPMTIKAMASRLRAREGVEVEYSCATCGASERKRVKPL